MTKFFLLLCSLISSATFSNDLVENYDYLCDEEVKSVITENIKVECGAHDIIRVFSKSRITLSGDYHKAYTIQAPSISIEDAKFSDLKLISHVVRFKRNTTFAKLDLIAKDVFFDSGELYAESVRVQAEYLSQHVRSKIVLSKGMNLSLEGERKTIMKGEIHSSTSIRISAKNSKLLFYNNKIFAEERVSIDASEVDISGDLHALNSLAMRAKKIRLNEGGYILSNVAHLYFDSFNAKHSSRFFIGDFVFLNGKGNRSCVELNSYFIQDDLHYNSKLSSFGYDVKLRGVGRDIFGTVIKCPNGYVQINNEGVKTFNSLKINANSVVMLKKQGRSRKVYVENLWVDSDFIDLDSSVVSYGSIFLNSFFATKLEGDFLANNSFESITDGSLIAESLNVEAPIVSLVSRLDNLFKNISIEADSIVIKAKEGDNIFFDSSISVDRAYIESTQGSFIIEGDNTLEVNERALLASKENFLIKENSTLSINGRRTLEKKELLPRIQIISDYFINEGTLTGSSDLELEVRKGFENIGLIEAKNATLELESTRDYLLGALNIENNLRINLSEEHKSALNGSLSAKGLFIKGNLNFEDISDLIANNIEGDKNKHLSVSTSEPLYINENLDLEKSLSLIASEIKVAENIKINADKLSMSSSEGDIELEANSSLFAEKGITLISARDIYRKSRIVGNDDSKVNLQSKIVSGLGDILIRAKGEYHEIASYTKTEGHYVVQGEKGIIIIPIKHTYQTIKSEKNFFRKKVTIKNHELYFSSTIFAGKGAQLHSGEMLRDDNGVVIVDDQGKALYKEGTGSVNIAMKKSELLIPLSNLSVSVAGSSERINFGFVKDIYSEKVYRQSRAYFKPVGKIMDAGSKFVKVINHYLKQYVTEAIDFVLVDHGVLNKIIGGNFIEKISSTLKKSASIYYDFISSSFDPKGFYKIRKNFQGAFDGFKGVAVDSTSGILNYAGGEFADKALGGRDRGLGRVFRETSRAASDVVSVADEVVTFEVVVKSLATYFLPGYGAFLANMTFDKFVMKKEMGFEDVLKEAILAGVSHGVDAHYGVEGLSTTEMGSKALLKNSLNKIARREFYNESFTSKDFLADALTSYSIASASSALNSGLGNEVMRQELGSLQIKLLNSLSSSVLQSSLSSLVYDNRIDLDETLDSALSATILEAATYSAKEALGGEATKEEIDKRISKISDEIRLIVTPLLGMIDQAAKDKLNFEKDYGDVDKKLDENITKRLELLDKHRPEGAFERKLQRQKLLNQLLNNEANNIYGADYLSLNEDQRQKVFSNAYESYAGQVDRHYKNELNNVLEARENERKLKQEDREKIEQAIKRRGSIEFAKQAILELERTQSAVIEEFHKKCFLNGYAVSTCSMSSRVVKKDGLHLTEVIVNTDDEESSSQELAGALSSEEVREEASLSQILHPNNELLEKNCSGEGVRCRAGPQELTEKEKFLRDNLNKSMELAFNSIAHAEDYVINDFKGYDFKQDLNSGQSEFEIIFIATNKTSGVSSKFLIKTGNDTSFNEYIIEEDGRTCRGCEPTSVRRITLPRNIPLPEHREESSISFDLPAEKPLEIPSTVKPRGNSNYSSSEDFAPKDRQIEDRAKPNHSDELPEVGIRPFTGYEVNNMEEEEFVEKPEDSRGTGSIEDNRIEEELFNDASQGDFQPFDSVDMEIGSVDSINREESLKKSRQIFRNIFHDNFLTYGKGKLFEDKESYDNFKTLSHLTLALAESAFQRSLDYERLSDREYYQQISLEREKDFREMALITQAFGDAIIVEADNVVRDSKELFTKLAEYEYLEKFKSISKSFYKNVSEYKYLENYKQLLTKQFQFLMSPEIALKSIMIELIKLKQGSENALEQLKDFLSHKLAVYAKATPEERIKMSSELYSKIIREVVFDVAILGIVSSAKFLKVSKNLVNVEEIDLAKRFYKVSQKSGLDGDELGILANKLGEKHGYHQAIDLVEVSGDLIDNSYEVAGGIDKLIGKVDSFVDSARKLGLKTKGGIKKLAGFKQQKQALEGATDAAKHELYKKQLRQSMSKPKISNPELKGITENLYRPNAKVGSGSTADALRYEKLTGNSVGGKSHAIKARQRVKNLRNWLKNNPNSSSSDKSAAEQMMLDLMEALGDI